MIKKSIPIEKAVAIAVEMHQSGQLERAEQMYVEILRQDPGNIDAIHMLGVLALQGDDPESAITLISRAISRRPEAALMRSNLSRALHALGRKEEAITELRKAVELEPRFVEAWNNLTNLYVEVGENEKALEAGRAALALDPTNPSAHNNMGNALRGMSEFQGAIEAYLVALQHQPDAPEILNNLGLMYGSIGNFDLGMETLRKAAALRPNLPEAYSNLGLLLNGVGKFIEAVESLEFALRLDAKHGAAHDSLSVSFRNLGRMDRAYESSTKAVEFLPKAWNAWNNLHFAAKDTGRSDEALVALDKSIELNPDYVMSHYFRANLLRDIGRPDEAIDEYRVVLKKMPDRSDVLSALGYALQERGELDEALEVLNRSIALDADPQTHSNVLMVVNYHPGYSPQQHYEAHKRYAQVHEDPVKPLWRPHANTRDPDRRLRVGYFSPDLRGHVVSYFANPIFENHDHDQFEVFAYSNHHQSDVTTLMTRARVDHWRETVGLSFDQAADLIRNDQMDILIELAGHTALNGLPVLARKPAPIQINGIGFPSTTGLTACDYRITDRNCDPPGMTEAFTSEKPLYMPHIFWCYQPPDFAPDLGPLPAEQNGYITFLSVNNFTKVTPPVLHTWARLVAATPESKIILQTSGLSSDFLKNRVRLIFASHGVGEDRVSLRKPQPMQEYMQLINSSDIMLDPYPFNGGTTSCHGVWMGTPILTLAGKLHAGRMGTSIMTCIGLPEYIAKDEDDYVRRGAALAQDIPRLREVRAGMRERLLASPMLNGPQWTRDLEANYRMIWREWCARAV